MSSLNPLLSSTSPPGYPQSTINRNTVHLYHHIMHIHLKNKNYKSSQHCITS